MKVLITGWAGFIGANLVAALRGQEPAHDVVVLDDFSTGNPANLDRTDEGVSVCEGSLLDPDMVYGRGRSVRRRRHH